MCIKQFCWYLDPLRCRRLDAPNPSSSSSSSSLAVRSSAVGDRSPAQSSDLDLKGACARLDSSDLDLFRERQVQYYVFNTEWISLLRRIGFWGSRINFWAFGPKLNFHKIAKLNLNTSKLNLKPLKLNFKICKTKKNRQFCTVHKSPKEN